MFNQIRRRQRRRRWLRRQLRWQRCFPSRSHVCLRACMYLMDIYYWARLTIIRHCRILYVIRLFSSFRFPFDVFVFVCTILSIYIFCISIHTFTSTAHERKPKEKLAFFILFNFYYSASHQSFARPTRYEYMEGCRSLLHFTFSLRTSAHHNEEKPLYHSIRFDKKMLFILPRIL